MVASYEVSIQESALLYVAETYKTLYPEGILIFSCQNPVSPAVMFFWEAVLNTKKFLVESRSPFSWEHENVYSYDSSARKYFQVPSESCMPNFWGSVRFSQKIALMLSFLNVAFPDSSPFSKVSGNSGAFWNDGIWYRTIRVKINSHSIESYIISRNI